MIYHDRMDHVERGLWIEGISEAASESIKNAVFAFQAEHNIAPDDWQIRVFPASAIPLKIQITVWIGNPPQPTYREPYTLNDDQDAGQKVRDILEGLRS